MSHTGRRKAARRHRGPRVAAAGIAALLLVGCSALSPPDSGGGSSHRSSVKVDTPALQALKAETRLPDCAQGGGTSVDGGLPSLTLPCLGGGTSVDVSTLRGPMVINLWAAWCGPCKRELPIYQEFHERYGDRVAVLGIDFNDAQPGAALELARDAKVTYPQLADVNTDLSLADPLPNLPALPGIIFVDAEGRVVDADGTPRVVFEEIDSVKELADLVDKHLGVTL